jgi:hypothetical protein
VFLALGLLLGVGLGMSIACCIIASEKRRTTTFTRCLESVREQGFEQVVVVADFPVSAKGVRGLVVPPMAKNTCDALIKRDVGWLATTAQRLLYLCDDHILSPDFLRVYMEQYANRGDWDVLAPSRFCWRDNEVCWLNMGANDGYVGGHAGIYDRVCSLMIPWAATVHHPNWDAIHSFQLTKLGARIAFAGQDLAIEDIEGGTPWL